MAAPAAERMKLGEIITEIDDVSGRMSDAFKEARDDDGVIDTSKITTLDGDERSKSVQLAEMHARLGELGKARDAKAALQKAADDADREQARLGEAQAGSVPRPGDKPPAWGQAPAPKSLGKLIMESKAYTGFEGSKGPEVEIEVDIKALLQGGGAKTVMSTGAGWSPENIRTPGSTLAGRETRYVQDSIPIVPTTQGAYVFMEQTTRTISAVEDAESVDGTLDSAAESAFAYTERTETLRKIRHFIPITDEQLSDVPGLEAEIDAEMIAGVRERLSSQIIAGDGTAPNIEGFLDAGRTGVNSVAKGNDDVFTAIHNGMTTNLNTGFADVDLIILNGNDWHAIRTTQTADGIFILGPPSLADSLQLWGVPVLVTTHMTENTALMGAFARFARVPVKGGVMTAISDSHASYFIQGVQAIKAELRCTLAVLREDAFTKVTSI